MTDDHRTADPADISDGYHNMAELYDFRALYKTDNWDLFRIPKRPTAAPWDGHTARDENRQLRNTIEQIAKHPGRPTMTEPWTDEQLDAVLKMVDDSHANTPLYLTIHVGINNNQPYELATYTNTIGNPNQAIREIAAALRQTANWIEDATP